MEKPTDWIVIAEPFGYLSLPMHNDEQLVVLLGFPESSKSRSSRYVDTALEEPNTWVKGSTDWHLRCILSRSENSTFSKRK